MKTLFFSLLFTLSASLAAQAQTGLIKPLTEQESNSEAYSNILPMDPYDSITTDNPYHYDALETDRTTLEDCFVFEGEAFKTGLYDPARTALWLCEQVLFARGRGSMSDETKAIEQALLFYEAKAREKALEMVDPKSLFLGRVNKIPFMKTTNWFKNPRAQLFLKKETGLDVILEVYGEN